MKGVLFVCTIGFYHSIVVLPAILTLLNRKENNKWKGQFVKIPFFEFFFLQSYIWNILVKSSDAVLNVLKRIFAIDFSIRKVMIISNFKKKKKDWRLKANRQVQWKSGQKWTRVDKTTGHKTSFCIPLKSVNSSVFIMQNNAKNPWIFHRRLAFFIIWWISNKNTNDINHLYEICKLITKDVCKF